MANHDEVRPGNGDEPRPEPFSVPDLGLLRIRVANLEAEVETERKRADEAEAATERARTELEATRRNLRVVVEAYGQAVAASITIRTIAGTIQPLRMQPQQGG